MSLAGPFAIIALAQIVSAIYFLLDSSSGQSAGLERLPIDDAWVRMVFIRNFAESLEIAFNPGDLSPGATSLLWVLLPGAVSLVVNPMGISVMIVAKLMGMALALIGSWLVYLILLRLTGSRRMATVGGVIVAIEPIRTFASVSGMEPMLLSTLALGAAWAYFHGLQKTTGVLMALMVITRPESWVFVVVVAVIALARRLWDRNEVQLITPQDAGILVRLVGPAVIVTLFWIGWNLATGGSPLPSAAYTTRDDMGFVPFGNFGDILQGYYGGLSIFASVFYPVTAVLVIWGGVHLLKRHRLIVAPLVLFALVHTYAIATNLQVGDGDFNFNLRRYVDPIIPFLVILLIVGMRQAWARVRHWRMTRSPADPTEARIYNFSLNVLLIFLTVTPFVGFAGTLFDLPEEYSSNTRNVQDGLVGGALWLKENTPANAVIGTGEIGAAAYFSDRAIVDYSGRQIGGGETNDTFVLSREAGVDYVFGYFSVYIDSWPPADEVYSFTVENNTILNSRRIKAWSLDFDRELTQADPATPNRINFEQRRLQLIDAIDVGAFDAPAESAEATHEYEIEGDTVVTNRAFRIDKDTTLEEDGRTFSRAESFKVASREGQRLVIAKRYDAAVGQSVRVFANQKEVGVWAMPRGDSFFGESLFVIPGSFISANTTPIRIELIPSAGSSVADSYFYWILVDL